MPPENQILRTPMTETPKHTINTCTEAYVSYAAVLVVATCFFLLTHIYSVCVSSITCVGTALRGDTVCTARNFSSNFSGFGRQQNFFQGASKFLPVRSKISSREKIYFFQGENLFLPVKKFTGNREEIYGFTNAYLSSTYKRYFFPQNKFNKHFNRKEL